MNYEEMSDFDINKLVAAHLHGEEWWHKYSTVFTMQLKPTDCGGMETRKAPVNYCKNPSDAWPIIVENKISLDAESECTDREAGCHCFTGCYTAYGTWHEDFEFFEGQDFINCKDENPLRAAMICFLKMKDLGKNHESKI